MRVGRLLRLAPRMVRRAPRIVRNAARDLRHGRFLAGTVETRYAHLGAHDVGNVSYEDLPPLFDAARVGPDDVIVDVGAGKGRPINWLIERYPGQRIVGIELDPDVAAATARRLRRHANVTIVNADATEALPPDGTVFYLFNPFDEGVMRRFAEAFLALPPAAAARRIVYHNCKYVHVFRDDPRFEVSDIRLPSGNFRSALVTPRG